MRLVRVNKYRLGKKNSMLTRRSILVGLGAVVAGVTFGCGGGSGSPAIPAGGSLSRMLDGDTYTFAMKGSSKFPTGSFTYSGTAVLSISDNVTLGSKTGLTKLTANTNLVINGEPDAGVSDTWYSYDTNGNLLEVANQDAGDPVFEQAAPFIYLPGTYAIGQSGSYTKTNPDATTSNVTWEVHEKSVVTVPAGKYETFVLKVTDTQSDGIVTKSEYYIAPQLGYPVKLEIKVTGPGGISQTDEGVLKTYSPALRG